MEEEEELLEGRWERPDNGFAAHGGIEVIVGSMFSGKTEELMRRLRRAVIARQRVEVFKPQIDNRYSAEDVVSHDLHTLRATAVAHPETIFLLGSDAQVIGIDEAQFFDRSLVDICVALADGGIRVIASGLDMDYERKPFGCMPELMAVADRVSKVHAICVDCGAPALYSHRLAESRRQVLVGSRTEYEPLCRRCYLRRMKERK